MYSAHGGAADRQHTLQPIAKSSREEEKALSSNSPNLYSLLVTHESLIASRSPLLLYMYKTVRIQHVGAGRYA